MHCLAFSYSWKTSCSKNSMKLMSCRSSRFSKIMALYPYLFLFDLLP
jgi:hypothetical protein